jgi:probable phosphoglycerate mutase
VQGELASEQLVGRELASEQLVGRELASEQLVGRELASEQLVGREPASERLVGREPASEPSMQSEPSARHGLRLILVRHGQTEANISMSIDSLPPGGPLTEAGRGQAEELAAGLAVEPVTAVYASTAIRAQQTAEPVARRHGLAVEVVEGLQEVFVGDLEGRTDHDSLRVFVDVFGTWARGDLTRPMPGGETGQQAVDRFTKALAGLVVRHRHDVVVLVSHGAMLRLVAPLLADNLETLAGELSLLANTARIVLEEDSSTRGGWHCVEWAGVRLGTAT